MADRLILPTLWPTDNPNPLEWLIEQHAHVSDLYDMQGYDYDRSDGFDSCPRSAAEHKHFAAMLKSMAAILELQILDRNPEFDETWASLTD